MGQTTGISWTHHTANFWIGCQKVSPGCEHCYAEHDTPTRTRRAKGLELWGPPKTTPRDRTKGAWKDVLKWNRDAERDGVRRRLFVSSLADIFEDHPMVAPWRAEALALLESCTSLDVQLLTKRPQNIRAMVPPAWLAPGAWPAHVWVGTTVEDQRRAAERIPHLLAVPARVRFLSCEPLLESVNLTAIPYAGATLNALTGHIAGPDDVTLERVQWVIVGGESGPDARLFAVEWARSILAQCRAAGVPAFMKQMGDRPTTTLADREAWPTHSPDGSGVQFSGDGFGTYLVRGLAHHGANPDEWPHAVRVQEFPR